MVSTRTTKNVIYSSGLSVGGLVGNVQVVVFLGSGLLLFAGSQDDERDHDAQGLVQKWEPKGKSAAPQNPLPRRYVLGQHNDQNSDPINTPPLRTRTTRPQDHGRTCHLFCRCFTRPTLLLSWKYRT